MASNPWVFFGKTVIQSNRFVAGERFLGIRLFFATKQ